MFKPYRYHTLLAATLSCGLSLPSLTQADLNTGLVAYYPFNGNANDASGNGNNGTVHGATLTTDRFGRTNSAFGFDGNGDSIELAHTALNGLSDVSFAAWFKLADNDTSVLISGANQTHNNEFSIFLFDKSSANGTVDGKWVCVKDTCESVVPPSTTLNVNSWYQITVIRNNSSGKADLYFNGELNSYSLLPIGPLNVNSGGLFLGRDQDCVGGCFEQYQDFNGVIDDVRIYNRALSAAEVQQLYQDGLTIPTSTTLTSSANPASLNQNLTFTASVAANPTPTGNLTFKVDGTAKQTSSLANGKATYSTATLTSGAHTIRAEYAGTSAYKPSSAQLTQTVVARPDFVVSGVTLTPTIPVANGTFTAQVTVKNQGTAAGNAGLLMLWANQAVVQTCGATGDQVALVGTLAVGASKTLTFAGLSAGALGPVYTLRAFVDASCATVESNEANNQFTQSYRVTGTRAADFVVTALTLNPATPTANGNFTLTVTVKNQGTLTSNAGYLDVWANQTATQTCGAAGNAWADIGTLAAGATKTVTLSLPAGVAGTKVARAFVDSWCETAESSETNNQLTKSYTVQ